MPFWPQPIKPKCVPASPTALSWKKVFPIKCLRSEIIQLKQAISSHRQVSYTELLVWQISSHYLFLHPIIDLIDKILDGLLTTRPQTGLSGDRGPVHQERHGPLFFRRGCYCEFWGCIRIVAEHYSSWDSVMFNFFRQQDWIIKLFQVLYQDVWLK